MKANTPELLKFKRLKRRLECSTAALVGHLELLWINTAKNAPQGDIGRFSNEEIAISCYWEGDPDFFVCALVEIGWLDVCEKHRLLVHDWSEHCPTYVKGNLSRAKKSIIDQKPDTKKVVTDESAATKKVVGADSEDTKDHTKDHTKDGTKEPPKDITSDHTTIPNQTIPNQTTPLSVSQRPFLDANDPNLSFKLKSRHFAFKEFNDLWERWRSHLNRNFHYRLEFGNEEQAIYNLEARQDTQKLIEDISYTIEGGWKTICSKGSGGRDTLAQKPRAAEPTPESQEAARARREEAIRLRRLEEAT